MTILDLQPVNIESDFLRTALQQYEPFKTLRGWKLSDVQLQLFDDCELYVFEYSWPENDGEGTTWQKRTAALVASRQDNDLTQFRIDYSPSWLPLKRPGATVRLTNDLTFHAVNCELDKSFLQSIKPLAESVDFRFEVRTQNNTTYLDFEVCFSIRSYL